MQDMEMESAMEMRMLVILMELTTVMVTVETVMGQIMEEIM